MTFAPLLSATYTPKFPIQYPVLASPKLDGIRVIIVDGVPMTRSLKKPVPNKFIQRMLGGLPWLDGEITIGEPVGEEVCALTESGVMSASKPALEEDFIYHIFDLANPTQAHLPFETRFRGLKPILESILERRPFLEPHLRIVPHRRIKDELDLNMYEDSCVADGYEGIMIRSLHGHYKHGRSTAKERILTKIKRWEDCEAIITEVHEELHNANEATINALGKTERSSHKENKIGKGTLGGYTCITNRRPNNLFGLDGELGRVTFYLGASANMTAEKREALWKNRDSLIGKKVTLKYQPTAGANAPRFPVFKNFRGDE